MLEAVDAYEAIRFIRTIVDFILLAMYKSYNDDTLRYIELALFRMNHHKEVFRKYRLTKTALKKNAEKTADKDSSVLPMEGAFNFPKFHAMIHYMEMIRCFGNAVDLETGHFEHKHCQYIKCPFKRTNKKDS